MKPLVLITNRFHGALRAGLGQYKDLSFQYVQDIYSDATLLNEAQGLIIRSGTSVDKDLLKKMPALKFVVSATAGFDHLDLPRLQDAGVRAFHIPESQSLAAAELTLALIFCSQRKWQPSQKQIYQGAWQRSLLIGRQVQGQKLGVIGCGRVGLLVAQKAQALGLHVFGYDPFLVEAPCGLTMMGFEELMRTVDIVSLHVPRTKTTRHMIKKETLNWMNTEATLINMSRGDVVNETDLIQHLLENPGFTAGLDVFSREPLALKSPLLELPNVVLTPHIGASTEEALRQSSQAALDKIQCLFRGEPQVSSELPPKAPWYEV